MNIDRVCEAVQQLKEAITVLREELGVEATEKMVSEVQPTVPQSKNQKRKFNRTAKDRMIEHLQMNSGTWFKKTELTHKMKNYSTSRMVGSQLSYLIKAGMVEQNGDTYRWKGPKAGKSSPKPAAKGSNGHDQSTELMAKVLNALRTPKTIAQIRKEVSCGNYERLTGVLNELRKRQIKEVEVPIETHNGCKRISTRLVQVSYNA